MIAVESGSPITQALEDGMELFRQKKCYTQCAKRANGI
jgi:hypothetical protein